MKEEKEILRKTMLEIRRALHPAEIGAKSLQIENLLFAMDEFKKARTLLIYAAVPDEVQTDGIISRSIALGKRTAVPSLLENRKDITPSLLENPAAELEKGVFGVREPRQERIRPVPPSEIDLVIAPGAAFDRSGGRVGFGGGYYDRLLLKIPPESPVIALAFGFQVIARVPAGPHDVSVDFIITEDGPVDCRKRPGKGQAA